MATVVHQFFPLDGVPPASNFATYDVISGSNFPVPCLDFDTTTAESIYFYFRADEYGSGDLTIDIDWYADTAASGNVVWDVQLACITPNTDSQDIETKTLGTTNTVTDSHLGTVNQRLHRATVTLSNTDSIAAGDWCVLKVTRDVTDGADTMAGDASLVCVAASYSDT